MSVRRLRDDVEQALALGCFEVPEPEPDPEAGVPAGVQTGAIAGSRAETARLFFVTSAEVARPFRALLAAIQRAFERDGWRCTAPGCASRTC